MTKGTLAAEARNFTWDADGFFILPRVLSDKECETLKAEALRILAQCGRPGATVHLGCAAASPSFAALAEHPVILEALRAVLPDGIEFLSDKIVCKKPGKSFATPWHIDAWYWRNTRPKVSVWIPFEDTGAENGALTVVPGSHRVAWSPKHTKGINGEFVFETGETDIPAAARVVTCELRRGDAVIFSDRLLHGSTPSEGSRERFAIISTYHAPGEEDFDRQFPARKVLVPVVTGH